MPSDPLAQFVQQASTEMLIRMRHGAAKFGEESWRTDYYNEDVRANLDRAVEHLFAALANTTDPTEWRKRAADVANQAFMAADPLRIAGCSPLPVRGVFDPAEFGGW